MEFEIPVFDTEVDTDDLGGSAQNLAAAVGGGIGLLGVLAAANYGFSKLQDITGVDTEASVPGV